MFTRIQGKARSPWVTLAVAGSTIWVFEVQAAKGLATVMGELEQEKKGFKTLMGEISKEAK